MEVQPPADHGEAFLLLLLANGLKPDPRRTADEWAADPVEGRVVSEGSNPGKWRNDRAPYLTEPMQVSSLYRPTRRMSFMGSAQIGKTQVGLNVQGQILVETPADCLVVLPSLNTMRSYNRTKLDRMIRATPSLTRAVADVTERSGAGSTTAVKRGARGAEIELVTASSSRDLQGKTVRVVIMEEVTEYDRDVGGRGDPAEQALARTIAWRKRGEKVLDISTPGISSKDPDKGCRITKLYEKGSGGRFLVPCPHCGHRQELRFAQLEWKPGQPETAEYKCEGEGCGALLQERDKTRMLTGGSWVHERPHLVDVHASYRLNTLYSPFTPWSEFAKAAEEAEKDPSKLKTFTQQWLGEAFDEAFELPKAEVLLLRRQSWKARRVPPGILTLMGATDVQGNRLEWAVWGFDRQGGQWLIDRGVIEGDPTLPDCWIEHDRVMRSTWIDAWGKEMVPDVWGIDSGYLSTHVYRYVRRHAGEAAPEVRALDGQHGWNRPAIGTPSVKDVNWQGQKVGVVLLWPVGTWDMKSELAGALRLTEQGPEAGIWPVGAVHFSEDLVDRPYLDQLLSEQCVEDKRTGERKWKKLGPNEAWDLAVYTRALFRHASERLTPEEWDRLAAKRSGSPEAAQADLQAFWAPGLKEQAQDGPPAAVPAAVAAQRGRSIVGQGRRLGG